MSSLRCQPPTSPGKEKKSSSCPEEPLSPTTSTSGFSTSSTSTNEEEQRPRDVRTSLLMSDPLYRPAHGLPVPEGMSPWGIPILRSIYKKEHRGEDADDCHDDIDREEGKSEARQPFESGQHITPIHLQHRAPIVDRNEAREQMAEALRRVRGEACTEGVTTTPLDASPPSQVPNDDDIRQEKLAVSSEAGKRSVKERESKQNPGPSSKLGNGKQAADQDKRSEDCSDSSLERGEKEMTTGHRGSQDRDEDWQQKGGKRNDVDKAKGSRGTSPLNNRGVGRDMYGTGVEPVVGEVDKSGGHGL
ncbi:MAG: hypothetical protein Q9172_006546 [Xanthocarpia lactea]